MHRKEKKGFTDRISSFQLETKQRVEFKIAYKMLMEAFK